MNASNVIPFHYQGQPVRFNSDGWINATDVASRFGKRPVDWLKQAETKQYLAVLAEALGLDTKVTQDHFGLVRTARGGKSPGTWLHPKLAVVFARWLDVKFSVWCDLHIDALLRGELDEKLQFDRAYQNMDRSQSEASQGARKMGQHRWAKPRLQEQVEYWRGQLQMTLGLDDPLDARVASN
ncbi:KilA-N domain-containing protein [Pseudomonas sp. 21LCFQ02]|uniref:KilA-N domain-containing protein n=1 Tax=Pseudomonas sp. 21LCFQ02 TaxID=2957505 RepID=UPI00209AEDA4|nr:KilA-N domain-containing protein [Pseudomonas sp. 21LCFQ02]MCO8166827.1 KilA-N domain-containing protein [Pseudomonas sp. 21LCFQ02]